MASGAFASSRAAAREGRTFLGWHAPGVPFEFLRVAEDWLLFYGPTIKESSRRKFEVDIRAHLKYFDGLDLVRLIETQIVEWASQPFTKDEIRLIFGELRSVLATQSVLEDLVRSPRPVNQNQRCVFLAPNGQPWTSTPCSAFLDTLSDPGKAAYSTFHRPVSN